MKQLLAFLLFLIVALQSWSQSFKSIDSLVSLYPKKFSSINEFASRVKSDFKTETAKVRAIYFWISNNIYYDYKAYETNSSVYKPISFVSEDDYKRRVRNMEMKYAERTLKSKKGVCEGYAQLFKYTCLELNIQSEVVSGFANTHPYEIGIIRKMADHAWNAVKINGKWKLVDATWSTGNEKSRPRIFNFTDDYFFVNPELLILNHYPEDSKWQLQKSKLSKSNFFYKPIVHQGYFDSGLRINSEQSGILKSKNAKTVEVIFEQVDTSATFYYEFKNSEYSKPITFIKKDTYFIAKIPLNQSSNDYLTIYNEDEVILEFKIIVK